MRNPSIDILRCLLMFYIVFGHCTFGPWENMPISRVIDTSMCFAVNAFIFISGWYSIKFSWKRFARFVMQGLYAAVVIFVCSKLVYGKFSFRYCLGWFGTAYLGLMVLAPLLNAGVDLIRARSERELFGVWLAYFVLVCCAWLPLEEFRIIIRPNGWGGHTCNTMLFMYVTGRMLSGWGCLKGVGFWKPMSVFLAAEFLTLGLVTVGYVLRDVNELSWLYSMKASDYQSPFMIFAGVSIVVAFLNMRIPPWLAKFSVGLEPSMFMVYLLHNATNPTVTQPLISKLKVTLAGGGGSTFHVLLATFSAAILVFLVALSLDMPRRFFLMILKYRRG